MNNRFAWCVCLLIAVSHQLCSSNSDSFPYGFYDNSSDKIDPQTEKFLDEINQNPPAFRKMSSKELNEYSVIDPSSLQAHPSIEKIENISIAGPNGPLGLRIYKPKSSSTLPVFIFIHGGGWTAGSLNGYDHVCQEICRQATCLLVSIDYGLAPQHPFPQPLEDCYFATKWVEEHIGKYGGDPKRIAIGGDSAGGNLTAAVTLKARENHNPNFICQVLICPVTNCNFETLSYYEFSKGYFLSRKDMKFFWGNYLNNSPIGKNPYVSPLLSESLGNLPQAFLIIANFDPLRDEGLAYGLRLYRDGVPTVVKRFNSIHGFYGFEELDISKEALSYISTQLKEQFARANIRPLA